MIINLPYRVQSNLAGYNELALINSQIESTQDDIIYISFEQNTWFEANLCAILGAIIYKAKTIHRKKIFITNIRTNIFYRNGFLGELNLAAFNPLNETVITYQEFGCSDENPFNEYIALEVLGKRDFPKHTDKLGKKIVESIFEVYQNARTHGKCEKIHTCGQYYPKNKRMDITIVDLGNTILKNVCDFYKGKKIFTGSEAIDWAIQYGNSTKINTTGGLGLDVIKEFIILNNGKIQIVSANGYWELKQGSITTSSLSSPLTFPGTIVNIEFNIADTSIYSLKSESALSPDNIF